MIAAVIVFTSTAAIAVPDIRLTPGAIDPAAKVEQLCTPGYTAKIRHVTAGTKRKIFAKYGLQPDGSKYEIDHFISLEIGGLNDESNLWPQPWPEARKKDVVETWLHRKMCAGEISLGQAQEQIRDWWTVYKKIKGIWP
jgi:hypothetical protein